MMKLAVVIDTQDKRTDRLARRCRGDIAGHDKFLPRRAFRLHPVLAAAGAVRRIAKLGDNAFQAQPAGVSQHQGAILLKMAAVADDAAVTADDLFQQFLALDQRNVAQIVAVEMKQVEDVEAKAITAALAEIGLQRGKIRCAGDRLDHELAVDQRRADREIGQRRNDRLAEFLRPVETASRQTV